MHATKSANPDCNKTKFGASSYCRKEKCLVDGYNDVDKLETSLGHLKRKLIEID